MRRPVQALLSALRAAPLLVASALLISCQSLSAQTSLSLESISPATTSEAQARAEDGGADARAQQGDALPSEGVAPADRLQCDPGIWDYRVYTFSQLGASVGRMLVTRTADPVSGRYSVGTEYWMMNSVPVQRATTTVSMADYRWRSAPPPISSVSFTMPQAASWSFRAPVTTPPLLVNASSSIGLQWDLSETGGVWSGSILWSQSSPSGSSFNALFAGSTATQTFTDTATVPASLVYVADVLVVP